MLRPQFFAVPPLVLGLIGGIVSFTLYPPVPHETGMLAGAPFGIKPAKISLPTFAKLSEDNPAEPQPLQSGMKALNPLDVGKSPLLADEAGSASSEASAAAAKNSAGTSSRTPRTPSGSGNPPAPGPGPTPGPGPNPNPGPGPTPGPGPGPGPTPGPTPTLRLDSQMRAALVKATTIAMRRTKGRKGRMSLTREAAALAVDALTVQSIDTHGRLARVVVQKDGGSQTLVLRRTGNHWRLTNRRGK